MAVAASRRTGSTHALSVTGVAGPGGGTEKAPAGTICIGLAHPQGSSARRFRFLGDRSRVRTLAAHTALDLLRKALEASV
jgi:nicotinamide-nucleotide amidase